MGRRKNETRLFYAKTFGIPYARIHKLSRHSLEQLENCKSVEAIRLLLGISRKEKT